MKLNVSEILSFKLIFIAAYVKLRKINSSGKNRFLSNEIMSKLEGRLQCID